jgi:hypothetical protein
MSDTLTAFKENKTGQYYKNYNGDWLKTDESHIASLHNIWVMHDKAIRYQDKEGFTVFDYAPEDTTS